ncbi:DUF3885 domain-containing protein [Curtobacterium oceanosedimentum]|uniref:DUF3885 domain-containing protein n=1 Tax=Curtobacterium oceanosedimentum TaxID=465820 RepID=UPI000735F204|nr:hypothetical protein [Curtobacterium oceanosedimentum]
MPLAHYARIVRRAVDGRATFRRGESSRRATALSRAWDEHWAEEPLGHALREAHGDRWVRFWSLPKAKRYADTDAEHAEVLRRHLTVLRSLAEGTPVWVIAQDWDGRTIESGWSRDAVPGRWPWRRSHDFAVSDEQGAVGSFYWVRSSAVEDLAGLLRDVAEERANVVVGGEDLSWVYAPYDGGADVILPTRARRDSLARRHRHWRSTRRDGL